MRVFEEVTETRHLRMDVYSLEVGSLRVERECRGRC